MVAPTAGSVSEARSWFEAYLERPPLPVWPGRSLIVEARPGAGHIAGLPSPAMQHPGEQPVLATGTRPRGA